MCQPMRFVMPARFATGCKTFCKDETAQIGILPKACSLANTQSASDAYIVIVRQV